MANLAAVRSVGTSLATYLDRAYRSTDFPEGVNRPTCTFALASPGSLRAADVNVDNGAVQVLLLLYRVGMNAHLRSAGRPASPDMDPPPLSIDLHYLVSFWAGAAEGEALVLAWTMRQLHETPVLDASILGADAAWAPDDVVQLIPEEISNEDLMRIWDALEPRYRLSLSYIARVVRIDPDAPAVGRRTVATRFDYALPGGTP